MSRTPEEVKRIVCNIVRFKMENQPSDLEAMVICIQVVPEYEARAGAILGSLQSHFQNIPSIIRGRATIIEITSQIVRRGKQIHQNMQNLVQEFLERECEGRES